MRYDRANRCWRLVGIAALLAVFYLAGPGEERSPAATSSSAKLTRVSSKTVAFRLDRIRDRLALGRDYRYAVAFRLSRDPLGCLSSAAPPRPCDTRDRGDFEYAVGKHELRMDPVSRLYRSKRCYVGYVSDVDATSADLRFLARTPIGGRVRSRFAPYYRNAERRNRISQPVTRVSRLYEGRYPLSSRHDQAILRKIGCGKS